MTLSSHNIDQTDHITGSTDPKVTLIAYGDYECPYSRLGYRFVQRIMNEHADKIAFVYRQFPLKNQHPHAELAAWAAESAGNQGKFWDLHNLLFDNNKNLRQDQIMDLAQKAGCELHQIKTDIDSDKVRAKVTRDLRTGVSNGVKNTPAFFINGEFYDGEMDLHELSDAVKSKF